MKAVFLSGFKLAATAWFAAVPAIAQAKPITEPTASSPASIPTGQLGAVVGKPSEGEGLSITTTPDGARLRCTFQRLGGQVTREGLWLISDTGDSSGEQFRVTAVEVGRGTWGALFGDWLHPPQTLTSAGMVKVVDKSVRFIRDGLTEEYSVSVDGVRQDFIIEQRPAGEGELCVELNVTGAKARPLVNGVQLVLDRSSRRLVYHRLRVIDAGGRDLPARLEVMDAIRLAVVVDDAAALYPVHIDPTFSDANWVSLGGLPGTDSGVHASAVDDAGSLYIGGEFTVVGTVIVNRIAKWDGSTWTALGGGMNGFVRALAVSGNDLYAGGEFTMVTNSGGVSVLANRVAKWNGSAWSALGEGLDANVLALATSGSDLYAGGEFTNAINDGSVTVAVNRVAKWNGSAWVALDGGLSSRVRAAAMMGSDLYVGGEFISATNAGAAVTVNRIARWDGSSWSALASGVNNFVYALAVSGSDLYAGGEFLTATNGGGVAVSVSRVAKWNGNAWSAMQTGMNARVSALTALGSDVYAGGYFTTAGVAGANYISKWNGSSWSELGSGMDGNVYAVAGRGTNLYAGGALKTAGGIAANFLAKWNGLSWSAMGDGGMNNSVVALATSDSDVYAGGYFTTAGNRVVNYIAKWDGSSWSALGSGMSSNVQALAVSGTNLYAGGEFTRATNNGGVAVTVNRVARWNGNSWSALGSGLNGIVRALTVSDTNVYAGGDFTTAGGNYIAKWNGSSWSAVGSGMSLFGYVYALASSGSDVYAGGLFTWATNSGGMAVKANGIAEWNGSSWSALGLGVSGTVRALATSGSDVYAGGLFTRATNSGNITVPVNYIAKWDGSSWSALGSGMNFWVYSLTASGSDVYAGGWFSRATNSGNITVPVNYIAKWDGNEWGALGSGMGGGTLIPVVGSLAVSDTALYAGGSFSTAGGNVSGYAAKASFSAISSPGLFNNLFYSPVAGFSCTFRDATPGLSYRIQTSPSLAAGSWTDLTNFTYSGPVVITAAASSTNKFFRAVSP